MQTSDLRCRQCGGTFRRPAGAGRPPSYCTTCRPQRRARAERQPDELTLRQAMDLAGRPERWIIRNVPHPRTPAAVQAALATEATRRTLSRAAVAPRLGLTPQRVGQLVAAGELELTEASVKAYIAQQKERG